MKWAQFCSPFFVCGDWMPCLEFSRARRRLQWYLAIVAKECMAANLQDVLETTLPGLGYELVDLELARNGLVRVFIDKEGGINVTDCVTVSHHLERLFIVEGVNYERLEISSPGLDRPIVKAADFVRFAGQVVKVKLRLPLPDKRKKLVGVLIGLENDVVRVEVDGQELSLPQSQIDKVRLEPQF